MGGEATGALINGESVKIAGARIKMLFRTRVGEETIRRRRDRGRDRSYCLTSRPFFPEREDLRTSSRDKGVARDLLSLLSPVCRATSAPGRSAQIYLRGQTKRSERFVDVRPRVRRLRLRNGGYPQNGCPQRGAAHATRIVIDDTSRDVSASLK